MQAAPINKRKVPALQLVPRGVVSAAGESVANLRPNLLRNFDLHPAIMMLTGVAIVALVCVIYLTQVTAVTNANYRVLSLQAEHEMLLREKSNLQLEIGRAQSLENIEKLATSRLQMVPVGDRYQYITIPPGPITAMPPLPTPELGQPQVTAVP